MPASIQAPDPNSRAIVITEIVEMGGAERACLALARWLHDHHLPAHILTYQDRVGLERFATHPLTVVQLRPRMDARHKIASLKHYLRSRKASTRSPSSPATRPALHAAARQHQAASTPSCTTPPASSPMLPESPPPSKAASPAAVSDRITAHGLRSGGTTIVTSQYLRKMSAAASSPSKPPSPAWAASPLRTNSHPLRPHRQDSSACSPSPASSPTSASTGSYEPSPQLEHPTTLSSRPEPQAKWRARPELVEGDLLHSSDHPTIQPLSHTLDWRLDIAGKGSYLEEARALTQTLGLADRVTFHGFVSDEQLQQLYDRADLFLMPAVQGYGIPAIESLGRGIPVLLHRQSGVSDILLDTPWATVFEGGEPNLASALQKAITSLREGRHLTHPLPPIPTEDQWAKQVAALCHWL